MCVDQDVADCFPIKNHKKVALLAFMYINAYINLVSVSVHAGAL